MLMTVLVTSFFLMSTSELNASVKDADNLKVRALADAVNIVIGRIRQATSLKLSQQGQINDKGSTGTVGESAQGAIRTFGGDGQLNQIYKLYSSSAPIVGTIAALARGRRSLMETPIPSNGWDINEPIVIPDLDDPENVSLTELYFPIADPRAFRGQSSGAAGDKASVEGFSYQDKINGVVLPGGAPNRQRLPMPVRWIYILADSSMGFFDDNGGWQGQAKQHRRRTTPLSHGSPTGEDDESCKINVNTVFGRRLLGHSLYQHQAGCLAWQ